MEKELLKVLEEYENALSDLNKGYLFQAPHFCKKYEMSFKGFIHWLKYKEIIR